VPKEAKKNYFNLNALNINVGPELYCFFESLLGRVRLPKQDSPNSNFAERFGICACYLFYNEMEV
jgi:hypothetical protein